MTENGRKWVPTFLWSLWLCYCRPVCLWLCLWIRVCLCVWLFWKWKSKDNCTCSFYQPVESSFQHSLNYSVSSFAWLRQAGFHTANRIHSHITAFLCHRVAWSLISHGATLHRSPISYSKGGGCGNPSFPTYTHIHTHTPQPLLPLLVRCPAFIDHKSTSLAALIVNHLPVTLFIWPVPQLQACPQPSPHIAARLWRIDPPQIQYWGPFIDNSFIVL